MNESEQDAARQRYIEENRKSDRNHRIGALSKFLSSERLAKLDDDDIDNLWTFYLDTVYDPARYGQAWMEKVWDSLGFNG